MTPEQISRWLADNLHRFDQPAQYGGDEPNARLTPWDSAAVRWCLVASWPYFHASGNQSLPAVYRAIHEAGPYLADRFYLPETPRDMRMLERAGLPVFGVESKHPLRDFDVAATSISYVVLLMNWFKMLSVSGIPPRWKDRADAIGEYPMVMVGGQSYCAPEPIAVVADAIWCGEAEDEPGNGGIGQVCSRIAMFKQDGIWVTDREACYRELAREFNYLYFPRFVQTSYFYSRRPECGSEPSKQVAGITSLLPGMRMPFIKRHIRDLDAIAPLTDPVLIYSDPSMGAGDLEAARGCPAWCSFCRLTFAQKPYRQHSAEYTIEHARQFQLNMGSVELSPFGPDWPMATNKKRVVRGLLEKVNSRVDATAMRIDDFIADPDFIGLQALGGMDSATLGLEGNSQRMRDLVGKGVSDEEVVQAVARGIRAGLRKFKLFMITNLPGEEPGDVRRIVDLARRLATLREELGQPNVILQFSWTPLLIEANTPFQWFAPTPPDHSLMAVAEEMHDLKVQFKIGPLDHREPVLTPDRGFVPIGQLQAGDLIVDPEGEPSKVTAVYPMGVRPTYRLKWSDGTSVRATADHPWDVMRWEGRRLVAHSVTTQELAKMLESSYAAPYLVESPGLATQDLGEVPGVLDPYLLGLLLGDGCLTKKTPQFSSADSELVTAVRNALPAGVGLTYDSTGPGGKVVSYNLAQHDGGGKYYPRRANPVTAELRRLGLWHHRSYEKFVPAEYRLAPAAVRLAVLQGLMDTDGTVSYRKAVFGSSSERLRDNVAWLARSLGLVVRTSDYDAWTTGSDGQRKPCRRLYRACVWPTAEVPVFRLSRKRDRINPRPVPRRLVSVAPEECAETTCISVSASSERYIATTGFIPTHNTKAEPNKVAFFQLCQRASRDVGEAIADVLADLVSQGGGACWGGVPRDMKDRLDAALRARGFANGFGDCFDERDQGDLFGWEFIDTGVSPRLLWETFERMREFAIHTSADTYDQQFGPEYHGGEWIARCDERCQGKACGVCDSTDLQARRAYITDALAEPEVDLALVRPVDQDSVAMRIRVRVERPALYRYVTNTSRGYQVRRAAYRACAGLAGDLPSGTSIAKRTVAFASDLLRYKDWSAGMDYLEFGVTRQLSMGQAQSLVNHMGAELVPWLVLGDWAPLPPGTAVSYQGQDTLFSLEVSERKVMPDFMVERLRAWDTAESVPITLRTDSAYFGLSSEEVDAKGSGRDGVSDLWLLRDGPKFELRMLLRGRVGPYQAYAALTGRSSWIDAAQLPAYRLGYFASADNVQGDLLRPLCCNCDTIVPAGLLGEPWSPDLCPRCQDEAYGTVVAGLTRRLPV